MNEEWRRTRQRGGRERERKETYYTGSNARNGTDKNAALSSTLRHIHNHDMHVLTSRIPSRGLLFVCGGRAGRRFDSIHFSKK